ncbi:MAG: carboxypeptidase regulatory-like domain-containing protein [Clostridia bacterium]
MKFLRPIGVISVLCLHSLHVIAGDTITNFISPVVSYQYTEDYGSGVLTNGGVQSPLASYQYVEDYNTAVLTNGGVQSPLVSYQHLEDYNTEVLTESGVQSPLASYQFPEDFSRAVLTNGGIISPFVSYQYFEWPGSDVLNLRSSLIVSYYYQIGNSARMVVPHGHVADVTGAPLSGVTVVAKVYQTPVAQAITDASGNYQMSTLDAGIYNLSATDATHQTATRTLTLNVNTAQQDFMLSLPPPTPVTLQVIRSAIVNYTVADTMGSLLRIFDGSAFVPITANNWPSSNLMTIVMTHGWVIGTPDSSVNSNAYDGWAVSIAGKLQVQHVNPADANILVWDWRYAATSLLADLRVPTDRTPNQGVALGEALQYYLGASYSQPMHFMGHSLGTLVNASAINYLHGQSIWWRDSSTTPWKNNLIHVTLFDQARVAEATGLSLLYQSPLPFAFTWADNYKSMVGLGDFLDAVNVNLQKGMLRTVDAVSLMQVADDSHGYPMDWYGISILNPLDNENPLGFKRSYEYAPTDFPPSDIGVGSTYHQAPFNYDELALEPAPYDGATFTLYKDMAVQATADTIQYTGEVAVQVGHRVEKDATTVFNYVGDIAAKGGEAVVDYVESLSYLDLFLIARPVVFPLIKSDLARPMSISANKATVPMVWVPLLFPSNAVAMAFDFMAKGDPVDDVLVCGIGTNNLFLLEAKYIPTNQMSSSRLIDVSAWAGSTNELFFGFMGGTSTNSTLEIQNIRFLSAEPPFLQVQVSDGSVIITWPVSAQGFSLQTTTNLANSSSWAVMTNIPAVVNSQFIVTNSVTGGARFYRLKQQ